MYNYYCFVDYNNGDHYQFEASSKRTILNKLVDSYNYHYKKNVPFDICETCVLNMYRNHDDHIHSYRCKVDDIDKHVFQVVFVV